LQVSHQSDVVIWASSGISEAGAGKKISQMVESMSTDSKLASETLDHILLAKSVGPNTGTSACGAFDFSGQLECDVIIIYCILSIFPIHYGNRRYTSPCCERNDRYTTADSVAHAPGKSEPPQKPMCIVYKGLKHYFSGGRLRSQIYNDSGKCLEYSGE
jgi:hypothetical protein